MFIGVCLIMAHDPWILFNDGFCPLVDIHIPEGSLLKPHHPAALSCRTHLLGRQFDILGGALRKKAPQFLTGAGWGSSPHMIYSGYDEDGKWFNAFEIGFGGIPARPFADAWTVTPCGLCLPTSQPSSWKLTTPCGSRRTPR